jgi:hypothetical protein
MRRRIALLHREHRFFEVRLGARNVADIRRSDTVHAAHVLQRSMLIDDEHMGRGFRAIQASDCAAGIEQHRCRGGIGPLQNHDFAAVAMPAPPRSLPRFGAWLVGRMRSMVPW